MGLWPMWKMWKKARRVFKDDQNGKVENMWDSEEVEQSKKENNNWFIYGYRTDD